MATAIDTEEQVDRPLAAQGRGKHCPGAKLLCSVLHQSLVLDRAVHAILRVALDDEHARSFRFQSNSLGL